jgi:hypothetical protein
MAIKRLKSESRVFVRINIKVGDREGTGLSPLLLQTTTTLWYPKSTGTEPKPAKIQGLRIGASRCFMVPDICGSVAIP